VGSAALLEVFGLKSACSWGLHFQNGCSCCHSLYSVVAHKKTVSEEKIMLGSLLMRMRLDNLE